MGEYVLRGGRWADVSAVANVLTHLGEPVSEALLFAASGGIGSAYSLRDFTADPLTLGFRSWPQDPGRWLKSTVDRLGLESEVHTTGSRRTAAKRFSAALADGPVLVLGDRGQFVVAYGEEDGRVLVDDRNVSPLSVERQAFDAARAPGKNLLAVIRPGKIDDLPGAVRGGLADCARQQQGTWARWAKAMTDGRDATGWPRVFAERRWLVGALLTVWTDVSAGGHLRGLFADALKEAVDLLELPALAEQAEVWDGIGERWDELADAALPTTSAEFAWVRGLTETLTAATRAGEVDRATDAAEELGRLRAHYDDEIPFTAEQVDALFADLGDRLSAIHTAESDAVTSLATALG